MNESVLSEFMINECSLAWKAPAIEVYRCVIGDVEGQHEHEFPAWLGRDTI